MEPEKPPPTSWLQRTLQRVMPRRAAGDVVAANVEQGARNVVVGKNIVQIGTLVVPVPLLALVLVALIATTGVVIWKFDQLAPAGPARMDGTFNIAIADFVELDARGQPTHSASGRQISAWVYNSLEEQRRDYTSQYDKDNGANLLIWHNGLPRAEKSVVIERVDAADAAVRQRQAAAIAEKIGADAVVYGVFDAERGLIPEFYVVPPQRYSILDIVGGYQLGSDAVPIDMKNQPALLRQLAPRTNGLFWLLLGLRYVAFGDSARAYALLSLAENTLQDWHGGAQGEELLYFFKGQSALFDAQRLDREQQPAEFQKRLADARAAFDQAITLNPTYARAYVGRGSVFLETAETAEQPADLPHSANIDQAVASYTQAQQLAPQSGDPERINWLADLGLAQTHRLRGQAYYLLNQDAAAEPELSAAAAGAQALIQRITATDDGDARVLGQTYLTFGNAAQQLGVLRRSQSDNAGALQWYTRARDTAAQCVALRSKAPTDDVLQRDVIVKCARVQADAASALTQLSGGKP